MKLKRLISLIPDLCVSGTADPDIVSIGIDSRHVEPGSLFFALKGARSDGHGFIAAATARGATALVISEDYRGPVPDGPVIIRTLNPRSTLALLAAEFYGNPSDSLQLIGVTGTNGKTTVTYMLQSLLRHLGVSCGVIGTVGAHFADQHAPTGATTPEAPELHRFLRQMVDAGVTAAAMEVSSHALEWRRVDCMRFDVAIFTNLTQD
ncbi:UDP-N-acetylmuramoyl-L-alanyl-D-glutamate--2,6-diaminopimelate ligase, partial [bacterium]|nr:UDP-N-acetylmuramoyl-L-alanyl-D-glutamate--2,6-diaminopimelate ligase [candidate division CSSED10-310 bacterium]